MIYTPAEDSFLLEKSVKKYAKNKTFLDMGAGSGIQSEAALKSWAKSILATDIAPESVKILKSKNIPCIKSDLFENLNNQRFDLIVFNPPYLPQEDREDKESREITTGGKKGDEVIMRFLKQAPKHLNKNGDILLIVSSLTPKDRIKKLLIKLKLECKVIDEKRLFFEKLEVWEITRA